MNSVNLPRVDPELIPLVVRNSLVAYHYKTRSLYGSRAVFVAVTPSMILTNFVDAIKPLHLLLPHVKVELFPRYYSYRYVRLADEGKETFEVLDEKEESLLQDPEIPRYMVYLMRTSDNNLHLAILYAVEQYTPPAMVVNEKMLGFAVANAIAQLQIRVAEIDKKEVAKILEDAHVLWRKTFTQEHKYVHGDDYSYGKSVITFAFYRTDSGWMLVHREEGGDIYGGGRKTYIYRAEAID